MLNRFLPPWQWHNRTEGQDLTRSKVCFLLDRNLGSETFTETQPTTFHCLAKHQQLCAEPPYLAQTCISSFVHALVQRFASKSCWLAELGRILKCKTGMPGAEISYWSWHNLWQIVILMPNVSMGFKTRNTEHQGQKLKTDFEMFYASVINGLSVQNSCMLWIMFLKLRHSTDSLKEWI